MTLILGIDPGLATGIAVYDLITCKPVHMSETGKGIKGFKWPFLEDYLGKYSFGAVACEGFTLRSSNKFMADLSGVKIIGWLEGEELCGVFPEPIQHMTITKLRKNKDDYKKSVVTRLMKEAGFPIGEGHTRMALSVAIWYAAIVLKHTQTLQLLNPKETSA